MEKALLLLSGGIDSPVAGFLAKEKFGLGAVHFSQEPFTDSSPEEKSKKAAKMLGLKELLVVDAGEEFKAIAENSRREYYFVLTKRFMMRVAEKIAEKGGASYLVTGESLGQVSSQTLSNLNSINNSTKMLILRPLLFMEKQDIIDLSRERGFYGISVGPELCDALAAGKPKTKTRLERVGEEEEKCGMAALVESAAGKLRAEIL